MSRTYTTKQGDMWDSIAKKVYGSEAAMTKLMEANEDYVGTVVFSAGITINLPVWSAPQTSNLPPWRR